MKKALKGYVLGLLTAAIFAGTVSVAYNTVRIVIDGKELIPTDADGNRVDPVILDGTTYLPVRAVANAFGKAVYWDGENYTVYLGNKNGELPYPTAKLIDMKNIGGGWEKSSVLIDNYGNYHSNAIYEYGTDTAQYILDGKYSRLKGTIYIEEGERMNETAGLVITADGKDIYTSPAITKTSRPIDIDVSVKGCNILEITKPSGYGMSLYLGDAGLYQ